VNQREAEKDLCGRAVAVESSEELGARDHGNEARHEAAQWAAAEVATWDDTASSPEKVGRALEVLRAALDERAGQSNEAQRRARRP
jgi:hypothetical protein